MFSNDVVSFDKWMGMALVTKHIVNYPAAETKQGTSVIKVSG